PPPPPGSTHCPYTTLFRSDEAQANEGYRVLVDRLWPRGLSRREVQFDIWCKDLAPSTELRKWFAHKPEHWEQFGKDYQTQLRTEDRKSTRLNSSHGKTSYA